MTPRGKHLLELRVMAELRLSTLAEAKAHLARLRDTAREAAIQKARGGAGSHFERPQVHQTDNGAAFRRTHYGYDD